jgi:hypothetical protein
LRQGPVGFLHALLGRVSRGAFAAPRTVNRSVPAALEAVSLKGMALAPQNRYATAKEVAADIEHWLADEPVSAYAEPLTVRVRRWGRRNLVLVSSLSVLLVSLTLALAVGFYFVNAEKNRTAKALDRDNRQTSSAATGSALPSSG